MLDGLGVSRDRAGRGEARNFHERNGKKQNCEQITSTGRLRAATPRNNRIIIIAIIIIIITVLWSGR